MTFRFVRMGRRWGWLSRRRACVGPGQSAFRGRRRPPAVHRDDAVRAAVLRFEPGWQACGAVVLDAVVPVLQLRGAQCQSGRGGRPRGDLRRRRSPFQVGDMQAFVSNTT